MATCLTVAETMPRRQATEPHLTPVALTSWKEVASFFARTVRTVQRWETTENLPVYHHLHGKGSTVYALESELIAWREARSKDHGQNVPRKRVPSHRLRLAVLPFANLSPDHQTNHFEAALTYELIIQLGRLDPARLGVIAYTSVIRYKGSGCNIAQIGRRLSVDFVLEGSVRLARRQVRMAAQLIDVRDQTQLLADACVRRWADGFTFQVAYAERMRRMIGERLLAC